MEAVAEQILVGGGMGELQKGSLTFTFTDMCRVGNGSEREVLSIVLVDIGKQLLNPIQVAQKQIGLWRQLGEAGQKGFPQDSDLYGKIVFKKWVGSGSGVYLIQLFQIL